MPKSMFNRKNGLSSKTELTKNANDLLTIEELH